MQKRFNKNNVIDHIHHRLTQLEQQWGFKSDNGYDQVKNADFQKVMAYGQYEALLDMYDDIVHSNLRG
jgi:hypothetical protein